MASRVRSAVRETYHDAMLGHKTRHEAFDLAFALVLRQLVLTPGTARRVVAVMLANEPNVPGSLSFEAASEEAVMPPARRSGPTNSRRCGMSNFRLLLKRKIPRLRRYARGLTRNAIEADELVQDCLVGALAKQHPWKSGTDPRARPFTVLHNLRINEIRRSAREESRFADAVEYLRPAPSDPTTLLTLLDLDCAIAKFPESQRQLVLLIGLEGMRYDKVAAINGVPIGTVRSRLGRAHENRAEPAEMPIQQAVTPARPVADFGSVSKSSVT